MENILATTAKHSRLLVINNTILLDSTPSEVVFTPSSHLGTDTVGWLLFLTEKLVSMREIWKELV